MKILNFGCGKNYIEGAVNIDTNPKVKADLATDIVATEPTDFVHSWLKQNNNTFDKIVATHVLEHVPDLVTAMTRFLELLVEGGEMYIEVPYDLSYGAWQDPTHVRAFNERSLLYYNEWCWYLGWEEYKLVPTSVSFKLSDYGDQVKKNGVADADLIRLPRAVDEMHCILKKTKV